MSYPNFGNVKTLTLPIPDSNGLTIAQYKEKYGIDLKDILAINSDDGGMRLIYNGLILLSDIENSLWNNFTVMGEHSVFPVSSFGMSDYESGVNDGSLSIGVCDVINNTTAGLMFFLPNSRTPTLDNIVVMPTGA